MRRSVALGAVAPANRQAECGVQMVVDAAIRSAEPLTAERLFGWRGALFRTG